MVDSLKEKNAIQTTKVIIIIITVNKNQVSANIYNRQSVRSIEATKKRGNIMPLIGMLCDKICDIRGRNGKKIN